MERRVLYRDGRPLPFAAALALVSTIFLLIRHWFGGYSWLGLGIFATVLALGLLAGLWRRTLASGPYAVLDSNGLTVWLRRGLNVRSSSVTLPWSNVAGVTARTVRGRRLKFDTVVVAVRDLERFLSTLPPDRRETARRTA